MEQQYLTRIKEKKQECINLISNLSKESRQDEANLEKAKLNIYEVFETLYHATKKQAKSDEEFLVLYQKRFETIPESWRTRLRLAREHDDVATAVIEEIKLGVVEELQELFLQIFVED